jgi:REP element-mobilizing transposase RayT
MSEFTVKTWSHGPHHQYKDSIVFLTWRLAFTLSAHIIKLFEQIKAMPGSAEFDPDLDIAKQKNAFLFTKFQDYDLALAKFRQPGFSLNEPRIAKLLRESFHHLDGRKYELHAWCVMSNHVHLLIRPVKDADDDYFLVSSIVQSIKRFTANRINRLLGREGRIWDDFYFDRIVRDGEDYENVVNYILMNPVKAGLVDNPRKWKDSFYNPRYLLG